MTEAAPPPEHLPRLHRSLAALLSAQRVAALGTLDAQDPAQPFVSMVPFALLPDGAGFVVHISGLAPHTANLEASPRAALMVMASEPASGPVHALARSSFDVRAETPASGSAAWQAARAAYLARFPEAEPMTQLPDFRFVTLSATRARQVAGFGAARTVPGEELALIFAAARAGA
ncbi:MAG: hypothetical protein Fur0019_10170 [Tibeticola sp.]